MAVTLDQDIMGCKSLNSSECDIDYDSKDNSGKSFEDVGDIDREVDCNDGGGSRLREFFEFEIYDFMTEFG